MSECKKLRISEIRNNVFIIERHDAGDPGKWFTLNLKGEEKSDTYKDPGFIVIADLCEYTDLESAEKAMADFLIYPRVVKQSDAILKVVPVSELEEIIVDKDGNRKFTESNTAVNRDNKSKEVLRAVSFLSKTKKLEELAVNLCDIEKNMNEIADDLNLQPFKISIGRINENVDNPM